MKKLLILPLLFALALPLGSCATNPITAGGTIVNPITGVTIYQVKLVYATGLQLVVDYRKYCWARPYATLMADPVATPICQNRRAIVRKAQSAKAVASKAVRAADTFVKNNPTLNAGTLLSAAWDAVNVFQSSVPAVPKI
jgi:hypothetical protein